MKNADNRLEDIEESFAQADEDGDGQINLTEFRGVMLELDRQRRDDAVSATFLAIDSNRDGRISLAEFRSWWLRD
jgi:Ca2+-binding EF-hand superfamily protein